MRWKKESVNDVGDGIHAFRTITNLPCALLSEKAQTAYWHKKYEAALPKQNNRAYDYIVRVSEPWRCGLIRLTHTSTIALIAVKQ